MTEWELILEFDRSDLQGQLEILEHAKSEDMIELVEELEAKYRRNCEPPGFSFKEDV